jgi:hypothetical protein
VRAIFMSMKMVHLSLLLVSAACSENKVVGVLDEGTDTVGETVDETVEDTALYDGASLIVEAPLSGDFLPLGEDADFIATVYSADGEPMDFDNISWRTDLDTDWALLGTDAEDDSLAVGRHAITAEAILPNGDRLSSTMGGILVQHEDAGIYVGDVQADVTLSYDGADYTTGCIGATTIIVDPYGETAIGDSSCIISLLGFEQELDYSFDMTLDSGDLGGSAAVNLLLFEIDFDVSGEVADGEMVGSWESSDFVEIAGDLDATRVSRDVGE